MKIISSPSQLQTLIRAKKRAGETIGLVPTMGALHAGHLSLVQKTKDFSSLVAVSIFVNPLQFGPNEDFNKYPKTLEADISLLEKEAVDILFTPTAAEFYPAGFQTTIHLNALTQALCGKSRPGHFEGVATVCTKLFSSSLADTVVFGEKDFQQVRVLEQMIGDLNLPVKLIRAPTMRDEDGLALSSRNKLLTPAERKEATLLFKGLALGKEIAATATVGMVRKEIEALWKNSLLQKDYIEIAEEFTLKPATDTTAIGTMEKPRLFIAAKLGITRLIDNSALYF